VKQGSQIYTIADLSRVWVALDAYEVDLNWLKEGQTVVFTIEALQGERFKGQVVFVDPILDEKTRTVTVRLNADNRKGFLKPGMFVRAEVRSENTAGTDGRPPLLVPASAVLKTGKRAVVYVRKPDTEEPVFEGREIEVGARAGDHYIVMSGLEEGEEVVVKGNFKIDSAFQIAAKPSMMSPEGGVAMTGHEHHEQSATPSPTEQEKPERQEDKAEIKEEDIDVTVEFMNQLKSVYDAYLEAQAALARDDFKAAQNALSELDKNVMSVSNKNLKGHAAHRWHELRDALHDVAQHANHWSDIDAARKAFEGISKAILDLERTFGHRGEETYYEVFCPMAFNNKGALWMQNHDTVDNPYFGASMLRCGEVRETFHLKK
jgi:Cu(I)/Ag(I) efflux system membrane fusion protein